MIVTTPPYTRPQPASVHPAPESSADPLDRWAPQGEVAWPAIVPRFPPDPTIDQVAATLASTWNGRLQGQERCVVGILVERRWKPTESHDDVLNIADAILDSGGLPRLIYLDNGSPIEQMRGVDALAIPGGIDVDPSKYGKPLGPGMDPKEPDPRFDDFEIACIRHAFDTGMPMLGQCRGEQIMNVAGGGTLTQDIPTEFQSENGKTVEHRPEAMRRDFSRRIHPAHLLLVEEGSRLHGLVGALEAVNSVHHQCIAALSPLLVAVAFALDGMVEGVERKGMPWQAAYQFHAEAMRYTDARFQGLYDHLVADGEKFKKGELFVQAPAAVPGATYREDLLAQRDWLQSQARQRFGLGVEAMMETPVLQAHFEGLAEEWRLAHPQPLATAAGKG